MKLVFSSMKYFLLFFILFGALAPLYAVLTDIIILSPLSVNPSIKPLETALIMLTALLASLGFTIAAFQIFEFRAISRPVGASFVGAGASGSFLATFASACVVCQPIWLVWLGLGSTSVFLVDYSLYIILASIVVLLYSINIGLKAVVKGCRIIKKCNK